MAVKVTFVPAHIVVALATMLTLAGKFGLTTTAAVVALAAQPLALVTVTVYVVLTVGATPVGF